MYNELKVLSNILLAWVVELQSEVKKSFKELSTATKVDSGLGTVESLEKVRDASDVLNHYLNEYYEVVKLNKELDELKDSYNEIKLPEGIKMSLKLKGELQARQEKIADLKYIEISRSFIVLSLICGLADHYLEAGVIPNEVIRLYLDEYERGNDNFLFDVEGIKERTQLLVEEWGEDLIEFTEKSPEHWNLIMEALFTVNGINKNFKDEIRAYLEEDQRSV